MISNVKDKDSNARAPSRKRLKREIIAPTSTHKKSSLPLTSEQFLVYALPPPANKDKHLL